MKIGRLLFLLLAIVVIIIWAGCKGNDNKESTSSQAKNGTKAIAPGDPAAEYRLLKSEIKLAAGKKVYLVIDVPGKELLLKLGGVNVWSYPIKIDSSGESDDLADFAERLTDDGQQFVRPVLDKHLYASSEQSSDSVLKIVSEVVRANVDLMQRVVPERFEILWDKNIILDIKTEVAGKPSSKFKNTMVELQHAIQKPFGEAHLVVRMDAERAVTLYRVAERGLPTLIYPGK